MHYKLGAALAVTGNFIIAVSLNVQKYAHGKREYQNGTNNIDESSQKSLRAPSSVARGGLEPATIGL